MLIAHERVLGDPVGFRILDSRFHARLWATAGNVVLERIAYGLYNMGLDIRRRATEDPALIRRSLGEHTRIVGAIAAGDPDEAVVAMGLHLDHIEASTRRIMVAASPKKWARSRQSTRVWSQSRRKLSWTRSVGASDRPARSPRSCAAARRLRRE